MFLTSNIGQMILAAVVFVLYTVVFFILGTAVTRFMEKRRDGLFSVTFVLGYFLYYTLFECVALPMKIMGQTVTFLSAVWAAVVSIIVIGVAVWNRKFIGCLLKQQKQEWKKEKRYFGLFFLLVLLSVIIIISVTPEWMGVQDDGYYIAEAVTSLKTDAIQQYHFATGNKLLSYDMGYFIPMYPIHGAVIAKLFSLHPIVENKWCSVLMVLILCYAVYYQLAMEIYRGDRKKSFKLLYLIAFFNFSYVLWGKASGTFLFYRLSEGKGILANLILPCLLLLFWRAVNSEKWRDWLALEIVILGSFSIVMSSMFLVSVLLGCCMTVALVQKRDVKLLLPFSMCMVPCIVVLVIYELMIKGLLVIPVL